MIRFVLVCLILAFVVTESAAFDPAPGARKCARNSLAKEYKYSAAVFIGEVVKVSKEGNVKQFEFDVERYWKGVSSKKRSF